MIKIDNATLYNQDCLEFLKEVQSESVSCFLKKVIDIYNVCNNNIIHYDNYMIKYKTEDYVGKKFNSITLLKECEKAKGRRRIFYAKCDCGFEYEVGLLSAIHSKVKQCKKCINRGNGRHNMSRTRLYQIWSDIKQRCYNPNNINYQNYHGSRGIVLCDKWKSDFIPFMEWAVKNGYNDTLELDRIDNDKNYEPSNCRFVSENAQACNTRIQKNNKSGYIGISWSKKEKKWVAMISLNDKPKRIGSYKTTEEAVEKRNEFIINNKLNHALNEYKGESIVY